MHEFKEEVKTRIDIVQIVSRYSSLKAAGQNYKGLCPFHKEKTPSFTVSPAKGVFHCFGCGKGGDIFSFVMEMEGLSFPEALQKIAEEAGLPMPKQQSCKQPAPSSISRLEALRIHALAASFFYKNLSGSAEAIAYLKKRNVVGQTAKKFQLGYAPAQWYNVGAFMKAQGISAEAMQQCGLVVPSSSEGQDYDRFRHRIMFPIFDVSQKVIGFGGRSIDPSVQPKYLNSPETILYHKSQILYGLSHSKESIRTKGSVFIVEGYFDCIALFQAGLDNVVATSGTALSGEHGHLLRRFTRNVFVVFDGDDAGFEAAQRAVFVLAPLELEVRVVLLPSGYDPDTFITQYGADAFVELSNKSQRGLQFVLKAALKRWDCTTPHGKAAFVEHFLPLLTACTDAIIQGQFIQEIAAVAAVKPELIQSRLIQKEKSNYTMTQTEQQTRDMGSQRYLATEEGNFWHLIVQDPTLMAGVQKYMNEETFSELFSKNLYSLVTKTYAQYNSLDNIMVMTDDEQMKKILSLMMVTPLPMENREEEIVRKVKKFLMHTCMRRKQEITRRIHLEQDNQEKKRLLALQQTIILQQRELVKEW